MVFLLGSDATNTMGQALLFDPCLVFLLQWWSEFEVWDWCSYCNDDQSLRFEGGVLQIFNGGGWLVGYRCSCSNLAMGMWLFWFIPKFGNGYMFVPIWVWWCGCFDLFWWFVVVLFGWLRSLDGGFGCSMWMVDVVFLFGWWMRLFCLVDRGIWGLWWRWVALVWVLGLYRWWVVHWVASNRWLGEIKEERPIREKRERVNFYIILLCS